MKTAWICEACTATFDDGIAAGWHEIEHDGHRVSEVRPTVAPGEPFVRDPESWQAVAAAGRKYA